MEKNIAVIWGDCSSPEIVKQTIRVLDKVAEKYGHTFQAEPFPPFIQKIIADGGLMKSLTK